MIMGGAKFFSAAEGGLSLISIFVDFKNGESVCYWVVVRFGEMPGEWSYKQARDISLLV